MDGFQVRQFIIIGIHTEAEEQSSITAIDDFVVPKLYHDRHWQNKNEGHHRKPRRNSTGIFGPEERLDGELLLEVEPARIFNFL